MRLGGCTTHRKCLQVDLDGACLSNLVENLREILNRIRAGSSSFQSAAVATAAEKSTLHTFYTLCCALSPGTKKTLKCLLEDSGILKRLNPLFTNFKRVQTDGCQEGRSTSASQVLPVENEVRTKEGAQCAEQ